MKNGGPARPRSPVDGFGIVGNTLSYVNPATSQTTTFNSDLFINPNGTNNGCQLANPQSLSCAQALTFDLSTLKLVPPFSLK